MRMKIPIAWQEIRLKLLPISPLQNVHARLFYGNSVKCDDNPSDAVESQDAQPGVPAELPIIRASEENPQKAGARFNTVPKTVLKIIPKTVPKNLSKSTVKKLKK